MGAPNPAAMGIHGPHMHPTGALWPGGSPLRAAGGQPCWNARPDQTVLLQSLQKAQTSPPGDLSLTSVTHRRAARSVRSNDRRDADLAQQPYLLDLDLGAGLFHLLFDGFRVGLVDAFLDGLRRAVDQVLGLLEAQARH